MTWVKMADQMPPLDTPMVALRRDREFASGQFEMRFAGEPAEYMLFTMIFRKPWDIEEITHWALVELPVE